MTNHQVDGALRHIIFDDFLGIKRISIEIDPLTIFVGESYFKVRRLLTLMKIIADTSAIRSILEKHGRVCDSTKTYEYLGMVLGDECAFDFGKRPRIYVNGRRMTLQQVVRQNPESEGESVLYIPSQRSMAIHPQSNWLMSFQDFSITDPFVVGDFAEKIHVWLNRHLMMGREHRALSLCQMAGGVIGDKIRNIVFDGWDVYIDNAGGQYSLALGDNQGNRRGLGTASSAQRSFVALLLGYLCALSWIKNTTARSKGSHTVIVEDPDDGLHPEGSAVTMLLLIDLLRIGYNVVISSNSPPLMEIIWGLKQLRETQAGKNYIYELFNVTTCDESKRLAAVALGENYPIRLYYVGKDNEGIVDISGLDIASENEYEAQWGGVARLVNRTGNLIARARANWLVSGVSFNL